MATYIVGTRKELDALLDPYPQKVFKKSSENWNFWLISNLKPADVTMLLLKEVQVIKASRSEMKTHKLMIDLENRVDPSLIMRGLYKSISELGDYLDSMKKQ